MIAAATLPRNVTVSVPVLPWTMSLAAVEVIVSSLEPPKNSLGTDGPLTVELVKCSTPPTGWKPTLVTVVKWLPSMVTGDPATLDPGTAEVRTPASASVKVLFETLTRPPNGAGWKNTTPAAKPPPDVAGARCICSNVLPVISSGPVPLATSTPMSTLSN